jgi:hypothetical protein
MTLTDLLIPLGFAVLIAMALSLLALLAKDYLSHG